MVLPRIFDRWPFHKSTLVAVLIYDSGAECVCSTYNSSFDMRIVVDRRLQLLQLLQGENVEESLKIALFRTVIIDR